MELLLKFGIGLCLLLICFQDFKERAVSWCCFPLLFILVLIHSLQEVALQELLYFIGVNLTLYGMLIFILLFYLMIRFRSKGLRLWDYLGVGDLLFFLVVAIAFSPVNFILFNVLSFVIALVGSLTIGGRKQTIPLAGWQAMVLLFVFATGWIGNVDLYNDYWMRLWN